LISLPTTHTTAMQNDHSRPRSDSSTVAAVITRDSSERSLSPILTLPTEIRQMIFGYILPFKQRLRFSSQANKGQAKLVLVRTQSDKLRARRDDYATKIPLLHVCRQFRTEALPTLIASNTLVILVHEKKDIQHQSLLSLSPEQLKYARNVHIHLVTHHRHRYLHNYEFHFEDDYWLEFQEVWDVLPSRRPAAPPLPDIPSFNHNVRILAEHLRS
jgi:2EXR family